MSLEQRIINAVDRAFVSLDDLAGDMTIRVVQENYDPSTGLVGAVNTDYTVRAVFDEYEASEIDGTLIQVNDRRLLVKPLTTFSPSIGDLLIDHQSNEYTIQRVTVIQSYDAPFLWELQVRR